jgi:glycosyltransferase involved in cell wall biosynthesis
MRAELTSLCPDGVFLGTLPHDQVAPVMASADLFWFPSATDTLGNVVLEAQAAGLPVVVSDRGGPHQQMIAGQTGLVCDAGSSDRFADAIVTLLTHPARRREMGLHARTHAVRHDWPSTLGPLVDAWDAALHRTRLSDPAVGLVSAPAVLTQERG